MDGFQYYRMDIILTSSGESTLVSNVGWENHALHHLGEYNVISSLMGPIVIDLFDEPIVIDLFDEPTLSWELGPLYFNPWDIMSTTIFLYIIEL